MFGGIFSARALEGSEAAGESAVAFGKPNDDEVSGDGELFPHEAVADQIAHAAVDDTLKLIGQNFLQPNLGKL